MLQLYSTGTKNNADSFSFPHGMKFREKERERERDREREGEREREREREREGEVLPLGLLYREYREIEQSTFGTLTYNADLIKFASGFWSIIFEIAEKFFIAEGGRVGREKKTDDALFEQHYREC